MVSSVSTLLVLLARGSRVYLIMCSQTGPVGIFALRYQATVLPREQETTIYHIYSGGYRSRGVTHMLVSEK